MGVRQYLLTIALVSISIFCFAKRDSLASFHNYANSIHISATYHEFPRIYPIENPLKKLEDRLILPWEGGIADQLGISYERAINKNWRIGSTYTVWNTIPWLVKGIYPGGQEIMGSIYDSAHAVGALEIRRHYKMIDLFAAYRIDRFKRHKIDLIAGISCAWGVDTYIDSVFYVALPLPHATVYVHDQVDNYLGYIAGLSYDYLFLKNRFGIGLNFLWRRYPKLYSPQIDYGFHVSLNI
jgi:hypothetical protein